MTPFLVLLTIVLLATVPKNATDGRSMVLLLMSDPVSRTTALVLGLFLVWPFLSIGWSITLEASAILALKTAGICLAGAAGFVVCGIMSPPAFSPTEARVMAYSILACGLLVLLEQLPTGGVIAFGYHLAGANFDKYIHQYVNRGLCALVVLVWPTSLVLARIGRTRLAIATFVLLSVAVAIMHSLSAKMGLLAGLGTFALLRWAPRPTAKVLSLGVPLCLIIWPPVFVALYDSLFTAPMFYDHIPESSQARIDIWHFVSGKIADRPWIGWGIESSRSIPGGTDFHAPGRTNLPLHPHNSVFQVLLEQGVVGLLLTIAGLAALLWRSLKSQDMNAETTATAGALILSYVVVGLSAFGLWQTWWIAVAWIAAILFRLAKIGSVHPIAGVMRRR